MTNGKMPSIAALIAAAAVVSALSLFLWLLNAVVLIRAADR